jgi:hypothetical protein
MKPALYHDDPNNTLLNDVFFYALHCLPQLQNMHKYRVDADADIEAFMQRKYPQLEGPPYVPNVHFFSKNLLGYLETLVAFCPYYSKDFTDKQLHHYITRKLTAWCQLYSPKQPSTKSAENEDIDGEEGGIVNVPAGDAVHST